MNEELELPGFYVDADTASLSGQHAYLGLNRLRLWSAVLGALGGASGLAAGNIDVGALIALTGFVIALVAELLLAFLQPERDWYAGRALAESMKTMSWCYAVGGEPFSPNISDVAARSLLRQRAELLTKKGADKIAVSASSRLVTPSMTELRHSDFETRRTAYLDGRTRDQRAWYALKARENKRKADGWRSILVAAEIVAVSATTLTATKVLTVDVAGILGSVVGASAAWLALKQHAQLAAAYALTSRELALQEEILCEASEDEWPRAVADAEDAISREHTMWLASHHT